MELIEPTYKKLPKWKGFNLLEKFHLKNSNKRFLEEDFEMMSELGFNYARLPMDYRIWTDPKDLYLIIEEPIKHIDEAIDFGKKYNIHVCLNFHRAPGFCIAMEKEPKSLWDDDDILDVCAFHWAYFAKRYKGIPNKYLSFDLVNEPVATPEKYRKVAEKVVKEIRKEDEIRLVVADGNRVGMDPALELLGLNIARSGRGYSPHQVSHYKASWIKGSDTWPVPTWPIKVNDVLWNKETIREKLIKPWKELEEKGTGVMIGEFGSFSQTPHDVVLAWMKDYIDLWNEAGWGYVMWNFRGTFGILDSVRKDVNYEDFHGHKLDRKMLELLIQ